MSDYLEHLASRSLDSRPLAVRPRLLSRFEAAGEEAAEALADQTANTVAVLPDELSSSHVDPAAARLSAAATS